ncbi:hypothetical protein E4S40_00910 [Algoriphagus kandeliae]|uniref:Glycosyltransferase RgtA/B/C/D-like domain-containing protein n=1 Tax=Algoriphagus kandeliae TaxID=2562278 RepID=A0A4Y9QZS0_9BACT|nr:hypothetical protein [Algoriphagus kandeliae]TFV97248.1 hypothetical protein E4S40_00910 [Algoriphagus kandeliae]
MLLALVLIWFLPWRFQVNDDELMMWLVSGAYTGHPESYAVFIHPVLSWLFSKLYNFFPTIPWYPLTWFFTLFISFHVFTAAVKEKFDSGIQTQIWNLILFACIIHFAFFLQFSIVSAIATSAGLSYRLAKLQVSLAHPYKILPSDGLILLGVLIRPEVTILLTGALLGILIIYPKPKRFFRSFLIPISIILIGLISNYLILQKNELKEFNKLNTLRSQVFDHPFLQLEKEQWKIENPEIYHFSNGLQDFENDGLDEEKLEIWKRVLDEKRGELLNFNFYRKAFFTYIEHEHFFISLMIILILFSVWINPKNALLAFGLILLGFLVLVPYYLLKIQVYALAFFFFLVAIFLLQPQLSKEKRPIILRAFQIALLGVLAFHTLGFFQSSKNIPDSKEIDRALTELKKEGFDRVIFVGENKWYHHLVFDNPIPFKVFGWSSLFEKEFYPELKYQKAAFLIHENTYDSNKDYFLNKEVEAVRLENFILIRSL